MRLAIALALVVVATAAWADLETHSIGGGEPQGTTWQPAKEAVVKWSQLPDLEGNAVASQLAADYPFDARAADDFYWDDGTPITGIEWWGDYWNPGEPPYADYFVIRFYADVAGSPDGRPGDLLYEEDCLAYAEDPDAAIYRYFHELAVPFDPNVGETSWISVQAVHSFFTGSQWGWVECLPGDYWNDESMVVFPELGVPDWTPASLVIGEYAELAFVLYSDVFSPVESTTWSSVKAMFR